MTTFIGVERKNPQKAILNFDFHEHVITEYEHKEYSTFINISYITHSFLTANTEEEDDDTENLIQI